MLSATPSPLAALEPRLRSLLPASLYADAWLNPTPAMLMRVFEHLRTLLHILHDHLPRPVTVDPPTPGELRYEWQEGTLMFTDLAGFTPLMEANAARGSAGARELLRLLNTYFAAMLEIISKSGGNLLEFTGDAMLIQFPPDQDGRDTVQAVRAGLRMQRAMADFAHIDTPQGQFSLGMRVGIHTGRFLTADIGTPLRMERVLLGSVVLLTKKAEGLCKIGRVCLSKAARARVGDRFRFVPGQSGHVLVVDDLDSRQLGEYDLSSPGKRPASTLLLDRSSEGLVAEIAGVLERVEPLASLLPAPILKLLVENTARRRIPPDFLEPTVLFVKLLGLSEMADQAQPGEEALLVTSFSRAFALINAAVEARGGVLKKVTYHQVGSDMLIFFGPPNAHTDDPIRAADTALAIREIVAGLTPPVISGRHVDVGCKIGLARGPAFAAEIGEPRGRREYNILGDSLNVAARLMDRAGTNQILLTEVVYNEIAERFACEPLGHFSLKGKSTPIRVLALLGPQADDELVSALG
ncbi:MAG: hypothetical protein KatS3mg057_3065 [Herpetosiphonaceae bacterium]|nr:MAG: hypothetical protein KatS3mg057_3065 [Herpetosiphonaceae bacterium]